MGVGKPLAFKKKAPKVKVAKRTRITIRHKCPAGFTYNARRHKCIKRFRIRVAKRSKKVVKKGKAKVVGKAKVAKKAKVGGKAKLAKRTKITIKRKVHCKKGWIYN